MTPSTQHKHSRRSKQTFLGRGQRLIVPAPSRPITVFSRWVWFTNTVSVLERASRKLEPFFKSIQSALFLLNQIFTMTGSVNAAGSERALLIAATIAVACLVAWCQYRRYRNLSVGDVSVLDYQPAGEGAAWAFASIDFSIVNSDLWAIF